MRARQVAAWEAAADDPRKEIAFVLTLSSESDRHVHFSSRPLEDRTEGDGRAVMFQSGLLTDFSGSRIFMDIREQVRSMPTLDEIRIRLDQVEAAFGGSLPSYLATLECELSVLVEDVEWDDRLVIIGGSRIDPNSIRYIEQDRSVSFSLTDPLLTGGVLLPDKFFDNDNPPTGWTSYLQDDTNGIAFPICYGQISRMPTRKIYYNDAGDGAHRFMLCRGDITGTAVTCHQDDGTDVSPAASAVATTDGNGVVFSYIELTDAEETDKVVSVSFVASSGLQASPGYVIEDLVSRWTGLVLDEIAEESLALVRDDLGALRSAIIIDGTGSFQSVVGDILDNRICVEFPVRAGRFGGKLCLVSIASILQPEGPGYVEPSLEFIVGGDAELLGDVAISGPVVNDVAIKYRVRNDSGNWDAPRLLSNENTDEYSARSVGLFGKQPSTDVEVEDVYDDATAGALLDVHRALFLDPWYSMSLRLPISRAHVLPMDKMRIDFSGNAFLRDVLKHKRWNLKQDTVNHTRDGFVSGVAFYEDHVEIEVIC